MGSETLLAICKFARTESRHDIDELALDVDNLLRLSQHEFLDIDVG